MNTRLKPAVLGRVQGLQLQCVEVCELAQHACKLLDVGAYHMAHTHRTSSLLTRRVAANAQGAELIELHEGFTETRAVVCISKEDVVQGQPPQASESAC